MFVRRSTRLDRSETGWTSGASGCESVGNGMRSEEGQDKGCVERTWGPSGKVGGLDRGLEHQKRGPGVSLRAEESLKRFLLQVDR